MTQPEPGQSWAEADRARVEQLGPCGKAIYYIVATIIFVIITTTTIIIIVIAAVHGR